GVVAAPAAWCRSPDRRARRVDSRDRSSCTETSRAPFDPRPVCKRSPVPAKNAATLARLRNVANHFEKGQGLAVLPNRFAAVIVILAAACQRAQVRAAPVRARGDP